MTYVFYYNLMIMIKIIMIKMMIYKENNVKDQNNKTHSIIIVTNTSTINYCDWKQW